MRSIAPVCSIHSLIRSSDNIRYDLLRTGSPQVTSNKILERGFLPAVRRQPPSPFNHSRFRSHHQHTTAYTQEQTRPVPHALHPITRNQQARHPRRRRTSSNGSTSRTGSRRVVALASLRRNHCTDGRTHQRDGRRVCANARRGWCLLPESTSSACTFVSHYSNVSCLDVSLRSRGSSSKRRRAALLRKIVYKCRVPLSWDVHCLLEALNLLRLSSERSRTMHTE